jgi:hypothetical protein
MRLLAKPGIPFECSFAIFILVTAFYPRAKLLKIVLLPLIAVDYYWTPIHTVNKGNKLFCSLCAQVLLKKPTQYDC